MNPTLKFLSKEELLKEIEKRESRIKALRKMLENSYRDRIELEDRYEEDQKIIQKYQNWFKEREYITKRNEGA